MPAILLACTARDAEAVVCLLAEHYARIALTIIARIEPQFEPRLVRAAVSVALRGRIGPTHKMEIERQAVCARYNAIFHKISNKNRK